MVERISFAAARRMALAAQGFAAGRPTRVGRAQLAGLARRLGMFQIDSVNVLARAHLMPAFSRLGPYDVAEFEAAAWGRRRAWFEYWGHEACLIPMETWPLLRWRMVAGAAKSLGHETARFGREQPGQVAAALAEIRDRGALAASELAGAGSAKGKWWGWSDGKRAMEFLFLTGQVTVSHRRGSFERVYDLPERVVPGAIFNAPDVEAHAAQRWLIAIAAAAMGVATERDLLMYWRLRPAARQRVAELVEEGMLVPVEVAGWDRPGFMWHAAKRVRKVSGRALLSPFDPVLWERDRALRAMGCHYRIGLYTPKEQRTDGYYVLPFLLGDAIAARVDLKADRAAKRLLVHAAHLEEGAAEDETAPALAETLRETARWLGLDEVVVSGRGHLAGALKRAVAHV